MALDFSGLNGLKNSNPKRNPQLQQKESVALSYLDKEQEVYENAKKAYKEYQEAIIKAGSLRSEIMKGVKNREDITALFLKAVECISVMTDDKLFYSEIKKNIEK